MQHLHIDIETYSPEPIADTGAYKYAMHPDFKILLFAYSRDDEPTQIADLACGESIPQDCIEALLDDNVTKHAHNATFERICLSIELQRLGLHKGWLNPISWRCSMVQCVRCGLPASLDQAGAALGLPEQKMKEGKALIKLFCTPHAVTESAGMFGKTSERILPEDHPDKWRVFKDYCVRDVDVEREICKMTDWYPVSEFEQQLYAYDQNINDRGALLDMDLVHKAERMDTIYKARLNAEAIRLTGMSNPNSVTQLKAWIYEQTGLELPTLNKKDIPDLVSQISDKRVLRILQIRSEMGKTSCKKYTAMADVAGPDNRVRGLVQFYGSRTGRWAGRLVQVQNLPQNHIPDLDFARQAVKADDLDLLELGYGNVPDVLSQLIRTAFVAPEGKTLAVCDFSAIEARVIAWMAGEEWVLDVFRKGGDIYCATASNMFHVPVEKHGPNAELRQKGKIAVLALGYGGGVSALDAMGGQRMGLTQEEEADIVRKWREANPNIVRLWGQLEAAAKKTVLTGVTTQVGPLTLKMYGRTMTIQLPSGRLISYPEMQPCINRFSNASLKFHGVNQETHKWCWVETYGGKLTENVIQATARDCLAETMSRVEAAGLPIIFHVHDELIVEADLPWDLDTLTKLFSITPEWAEGLPLKGAGYTTPYYLKD